MKSLAQALKDRAEYLRKNPSGAESAWGENHNTVAVLLELADVLNSWSGEYLSKEDAEQEYHRRKYGYIDENGNHHPGDYNAKPLDMKERCDAVKNIDSIQDYRIL
jgi:hypothetical protein